jgi:hypothetical protein
MNTIILERDTQILLTAWSIASAGHEFSGLADVRRDNEDLVVSNAHVGDVGSWGMTDLMPDWIRSLPTSENRRVWFHRHPIYGWSGTDLAAINMNPCGAIPEILKWGVSIVLTPRGWIGRVDFYGERRSSHDLPVVPNYANEEIWKLAKKFQKDNNLDAIAETMYQAYVRRGRKNYGIEETEEAEVKLSRLDHHDYGYASPRREPKKSVVEVTREFIGKVAVDWARHKKPALQYFDRDDQLELPFIDMSGKPMPRNKNRWGTKE